MRRSIGATNPSGADELQLVELIGEGSFGKVLRRLSAGRTRWVAHACCLVGGAAA